MYQRRTCIEQVEIWYFFLLSYFLLKIVSVINELYCCEKIVTYFAKVLQNCWCSQRCSKKFRKFHWKTPVPGKMWTWKFDFIHKNWTFFIKETSAHSYFLVSSAEFLRILSFRTLLGEYFWLIRLCSTYLNQTNSWNEFSINHVLQTK